ncbi:MAG: hypothetical protein PVG39_00835 [Desulfobacteraceae bacterium]|jgi:hypothetical protein
MKCVCERRCWIRNKIGKIRYYAEGDIDDFDKVPTHFQRLDGEPEEKKFDPSTPDQTPAPDFSKMSEEDLKAGKFELKRLKEFISERYGVSMGNTGLEKTVEKFIELRMV